MLDFLRTGRRPVDARDLLAMISAQYPDSEKALRVFVAACHDDQRYVRACIEYAFHEWISTAGSDRRGVAQGPSRSCRHWSSTSNASASVCLVPASSR